MTSLSLVAFTEARHFLCMWVRVCVCVCVCVWMLACVSATRTINSALDYINRVRSTEPVPVKLWRWKCYRKPSTVVLSCRIPFYLTINTVQVIVYLTLCVLSGCFMSFIPLLIFMPRLSFNISYSRSLRMATLTLSGWCEWCYHGDLFWFRVAMVHTLPWIMGCMWC